MFFDPRKAKLLKPGEHMVIEGCQGLRLEARASCKTWVYRYKLGGKMKQAKLGQWPELQPSQASTKWQALRDGKTEGVDPRKAKAQAPKASGYTVAQCVADYIEGELRPNRKDSAAQERALNLLLASNPDFAAMLAEAVTRGVAFGVIEARKATPTAAGKLRSMLGTAWAYGLDSGKLVEAPNWWREVHRGKLKSKGKISGGKHQGRNRRVLQPDEVAELMNWSSNMHSHGRDFITLYLWTTVRGAEIESMRAEHVEQERDGWWWTVPKALTKNAGVELATDHRVALTGRALEVVQRRIAMANKSGYLFESTTGAQYLQKDLSTYIYNLQPYSPRVRDRASGGLVLPVTNWTPHDLRRTSRTLLTSIDCPKEVGEAMLGHLPPNIEATYNLHTYDEQKRKWAPLLAAHLERIIAASQPGHAQPLLAAEDRIPGKSPDKPADQQHDSAPLLS